MEILVIASRLPYPVVSGGVKRLVNICERLRQDGNRLTLVTFVESKDQEQFVLAGRLKHVFDEVKFVRLNKIRMFCNLLSGLFSRLPLQVKLFNSLQMRSLIQELCRSGEYSLSICHMIRVSEYQKLVRADKKIIELTDSLSLSFHRKADQARGDGVLGVVKSLIYQLEANRLRVAETEAVRANDKAVVVSDIDRSYIAERCDDQESQKLYTVPLGVSEDLFLPISASFDRDCIVFVGKMDYEPNERAVLHFAEQIFPSIRAIIPSVTFRVVGASPTAAVRRLAVDGSGIQVTGVVDTISDYVATAGCSVALMQSGAGMQTKILESLAMGVPVVTNELGYEGLEFEKNTELFVAQTDDQAVNMIVTLLTDVSVRRDMIVNGQRALRTKYGIDTVLANYIDH